MKSPVALVIPSKFLCLVSHLTMIFITLYSKDSLIDGSMYSDLYNTTEYDDFDSWLTTGSILAICMICVELVVLLYGVTFFMTFLATIEVVLHATGTILLALCVIETWHLEVFSWIFWIGSFAPFTLEILALVKHFISST